jgi:hypothetical protein
VEIRREVPAGEIDVRARTLDLGRDRREGLGAVDEDLDQVPRTRRRLATCPAACGRLECAESADSPQPPPMVSDDEALQPLAESGVGTSENSVHG